MHRQRSIIAFALTMVVASVLSGCLKKDVGVALIPSTATLDFGSSQTRMTLDVSRNVSSTPSNPLVVSSSADWVVPEACLDSAAGCMVNSTLLSVHIPVSIRRDLLAIGTNRAKLYLSAGPSSVLEVEVVADDRIQPDFVADVRSVGLGRPVVFRDLSVAAASAGAVSSWQWDFGDGTTGIEQNPTHLYAAPGTYDVSLTVKAGAEQETVKRAGYIKVNSPQVAVDFSASSTNIPINAVVAFTDLSSSTATPITGWKWDFGDGISSTDRNPYHQYNVPGMYTVTLTVTTQFDAVAKTKPNYITVRQKIGPTANFAISDVKPLVNTPIRFTDLSDPGSSPITNWVWEFKDLFIVNEQNPVHSYAKTGTYNVKLTVFTQEGVSSKTIPITVDYRPPTAEFSVDKTLPSVDEAVQFTDRSQPGSNNIVSWAWDFGDKGTSTDQNPSHAYAKIGKYTVTLTVRSADPSNNENTVVKENLITVVQPPNPDFDWTPPLALTGTLVNFNSASTVAGTEPITKYEWRIQGTITAGPTATHTFTAPGVYSVALTVSTATRSVTVTKPVAVDKAPSSDFSAAPTTGFTHDDIVFTPVAQAAGTRPITGYLWSFGDGATSANSQPTHKYAAQGTYTVRLTLYFKHTTAPLPTDPVLSVTTEKAGYITITAPVPPTATFGSSPAFPITDMPVEFTLTSYSSPTRPITKLEWDFDDGSPVLAQTVNLSSSSDPAPPPVSHTYTTANIYHVKLTITAAALDPAVGVVILPRLTLTVIAGTPLDRFVRTDDGAYGYNLVNQFPVNYGNTSVKIADAYVIQLTSQVWHANEIYSPQGGLWKHYLTLVNPVERLTDTAMLFVNGGSNPDFSQNPPSSVDSFVGLLAILSGSPIALLDTIPSEPIVFKDEVTPGSAGPNPEESLILRSRSEDAIIAYTYNKYVESYNADPSNPDTTWPLLFPMAKAAVKAMDTVQAIASDPGVSPPFSRPVTDFVVTGASKRGWTTWMTGIADPRIKGIAPIVIDVLNMDKQMVHHRAAYGYWAPSIYEYAQERIFDRMLPQPGTNTIDPAAAELLKLVDPYRYINVDGFHSQKRLDMPKFLTNGTGDQFFLPDSAQWYFKDLPAIAGTKYLNYIPNGDHGLIDSNQAIDPTQPGNPAAALLAWFMSVTQNKTQPEFSWVLQGNGANASIKVTVDPARKPKSVKMWHATAPDKRDFRIERGADGSLRNPDGSLRGPEWFPQSLQPTTAGGNEYLASVSSLPAAGSYTGIFVQLTYANTAQLPNIIASNPALGITVPDLVFTTEVKMLPQNSDGTNLYPDFAGVVANREPRDPAIRPTAVPFAESKAPVVVLHGDATQMGADYGELMAQEISEFIPNYISSYTAAYGVSEQTLTNEWIAMQSKIDPRITDEMTGILAGMARPTVQPPVTVPTLVQMRQAHMIALRDSDSRNGAASTGTNTGTGAAAAAWRSRAGGATLHAVTVNGSGQLSWMVGGTAMSPQDYKCIVVYIPQTGVPHTLLTFAGLSIGRTGVNLGGISWSDQIDTSNDVLARTNLGRMFLGRKVLYDSLNLNEAVNLVANNPVERACTIIVADGRNHLRGAVIQTTPGLAPVIIYNQSADFTAIGPQQAGMVYDASQSLLANGYFAVIDSLWGSFNEANFLTLALDPSVTAQASKVNQLNAVYSCSEASLRVNFSYAVGQTMAWAVPYATFDMQLLLP